MTTIIPMAESHLAQIWHIEQQVHFHPWKESMIRDLTGRGTCHHVLLVEGTVAGYFYAQDIVGEMSLLNIAVHPDFQGRGLGKQLVSYLIALCEARQVESIWLEVRESNVRAFNLYQALGFNEIDRRFDYYPTKSGYEDAIVMSYVV